MDELIKKMANLGLPAIIFLSLVASQGSGMAAITFLAGMGGPLGILGGLGILGLTGIAGDLLAGYGLETLLIKIYEERRKNESIDALSQEIKELPITDCLKMKLEESLHTTKSEPVTEAPAEPRTVEIVD